MDLISIKKQVIRKYFENLNNEQFKAVTTTEGPLLILAGAGSGKTTVLVNRILNIIKFGNSYNDNFVPNLSDGEIKLAEDYINGLSDNFPFEFENSNVKPWEILAITFTNKAANELKERIANKLGDISSDIWAGTFHSVCGKILRYNAEKIGFSSHFTIYDSDDQKRVIKEIMKQNNIDDKYIQYKSVLNAISDAKDKLITPDEFLSNAGNDYRQEIIGKLYKLYQKNLENCDAMDFDDMIFNTVKLLNDNKDVLNYYSNKFKYILVDEYQDTNRAQYVLVSLLASKNNNLCVVGDDDQSIYRFRGATIENILNFEDDYNNALTIRLEQNYRSTSNILNAANNVISNNKGRKGKTLWTDNGEGNKITVYTANDERDEAKFVVDKILDNVKNGGKFSDNAVLYRMNAQSNQIENVFLRSGIVYKVIGGIKFYDRKEVKDIIAYLQLINNNNDDLRLKRIINEPKRGIGNTTINRASEIASGLGLSIFEVLNSCDDYPSLSRSSTKIKDFCELINELTQLSSELSITELFNEIIDKTKYFDYLSLQGDEGKDRIENVKEFGSTIAQYELDSYEPNLSDFLEQLALISDIDSLDNNSDYVVLMTVHSAKGLEFKNVYLVGMEEGIFPGTQSIFAGNEEIEEERRLAYVAITRAKKNLVITNASMRMIFGTTSRNLPSRFVKEIPEDLCDILQNSFTYYKTEKKNYINSSNNYSYLKNSFVQGNDFNASKYKVSENVYSIGQTVKHKAFGTGVILSVVKVSDDYLLEIAFDSVGTKKIMANFAKLTF